MVCLNNHMLQPVSLNVQEQSNKDIVDEVCVKLVLWADSTTCDSRLNV